ncbi:Cys-tRNA(Pro)/Cys-tRNA(Cys) deacylase YbaK [Baekduia alba]|uniref:Cys-tRNA(Pro) deacylase n=1 Tax=Baekduia alba TaxID=2997333 RepID=UPI002340E741|nr:Cys-tRNA(Pro) deacylase [Baekduia alba]WCB91870.1 Cys-tRNA(Pro)/Cys-tRNA(Cys) deacylase YbaK [Baekduia alba]
MAGRQTPATRAAEQAGIAYTLHEYDHDPRAASYAGEAAAVLGLDPERVFKTLVVAVDDDLAVAIVPAADQLDLKAVGKRAALADTARAEKVTGYVAGGISPLGQRRALPTFLDETAELFDTIFVSAGRRGLEIELAPSDLVALTGADVRPLARS